MLVLMCGTSFSGKSTFARALAAETQAMIISLDEINERRGLWGGDGIALEEWQRTHEIATAETRAHLLGEPGQRAVGGRTVIVDDTSSPRFLRDGWRSLAAEIGVGFVLVYLDVDQATIRRRQADNRVDQGRRDVADAVLKEHLAGFEPPEPDEDAVRVTSADDLVQVLKYFTI
jgi:predicted kinase